MHARTWVLGWGLLPLVACMAPAEESPGDDQAAAEETAGQVAFISDRDGNFDIFLLDVATDSVVNLTAHSAMEWGLSWSPDGMSIAFGSNRDGNDEIYLMRVEDRSVTRLTDHEARDGAPNWSPDGTRIAFVSRRDSERGELYVVGVDGTGLQRLTDDDRYEEVPNWSPDGSSIAFGALAPFEEGADPTLQIFRLDLATGEETQLTRLPGHNSAPRWSPDGTRILFYGQVGEGFEGADILSIAADGTDLRNLTNDAEPDWQPHLNPAGDRIVFARGPGDPLDLWTMDADGGDRRPLVVNPGRDEQPSWRPAGR